MKSKSILAAVIAVLTAIPATNIAFAAEQQILGDVNGNSEVDIRDVTEIQKHLVGLTALDEAQLAAADVNGDGTVDINDATYIQKYLANMDVTYAIGQPIETTVNEDAWKENTGTIRLSNSGIEVTGVGAYVEGNKVYITEGGDWEVTGTCDNGMIYVNTGEEKDVNDKVKLRLNGMSLTNTSGPAIYFDRCKKSFITVESGSENTVTDSATYDEAYAEAKGAIHSDDSLEIKGKGSLTVNGNYKHGINSDDDIVIENGVFQINSATDGLHANDYIVVDGKNIKLNIDSQSDGIESEGYLTIDKASLDVEASGKGIKAEGDLSVLGGTVKINSTDDTVHSNTNITISGGTFDLRSGDDGIHADTTLTISGGEVNVSQSYEGLEANDIVIDGGTINVAASDDGLNAAGGNDQSSQGGRPGQNQFQPGTASNSSITINDGYVYVISSGDGIDSNGALNLNGGTVIVQGPASGGNSCMDADGVVQFNGGTVLGISSSNAMWEDIRGKISTAIYNTSVGRISSGSVIAVTDSSGNVLSAFKPTLTGNIGILYMTDQTSSISSCKFNINGTYSGTLDSFGYGEGGTISGGTTVNPSTATNGNNPWRPGRP